MATTDTGRYIYGGMLDLVTMRHTHLLYLELYTGSGIFQFRIFESLPDESIGNRRMDDFEDRDSPEDQMVPIRSNVVVCTV